MINSPFIAMINRYHAWSIAYHSMINRFHAWSTAFHSMINRYHAWSIAYHGMINKFHTWSTWSMIMNDHCSLLSYMINSVHKAKINYQAHFLYRVLFLMPPPPKISKYKKNLECQLVSNRIRKGTGLWVKRGPKGDLTYLSSSYPQPLGEVQVRHLACCILVAGRQLASLAQKSISNNQPWQAWFQKTSRWWDRFLKFEFSYFKITELVCLKSMGYIPVIVVSSLMVHPHLDRSTPILVMKVWDM